MHGFGENRKFYRGLTQMDSDQKDNGTSGAIGRGASKQDTGDDEV